MNHNKPDPTEKELKAIHEVDLSGLEINLIVMLLERFKHEVQEDDSGLFMRYIVTYRIDQILLKLKDIV